MSGTTDQKTYLKKFRGASALLANLSGSVCDYTSITVQPYLRAQPPLRKSSQLAFLTCSAEPNVGKLFALLSLFPYIKC